MLKQTSFQQGPTFAQICGFAMSLFAIVALARVALSDLDVANLASANLALANLTSLVLASADPALTIWLQQI